jgi:hypothetical protein
MYRWRGTLRLADRVESLVLEIPPRGAAYSLTRLSHIGHPVHLALVEAYLAGEVPTTADAPFGADASLAVANLAAPLVWMRMRAKDSASIADLQLLATSRCPGARSVFRDGALASLEVAESGSGRTATSEAGETMLSIESLDGGAMPDPRPRLWAGYSLAPKLSLAFDPLANAEPPAPRWSGPATATPSVDTNDPHGLEHRREALWSHLEELIAQPITERRTEGIVFRASALTGDSRFLVGWSLVLPRNRHVFAAWLGADGHTLIRMQD